MLLPRADLLAVKKSDCVPPKWVIKTPELQGYYWGIGDVPLEKDQQKTKHRSYEEAVGNLALMAGQIITASYEEYIAEKTVGKKSVQDTRFIHKIKTIAKHELRGITIKDFWLDDCEKIYYVLVVIDQILANNQINKNSQIAKDEKLREVIQKGITMLERRVTKIEKTVNN